MWLSDLWHVTLKYIFIPKYGCSRDKMPWYNISTGVSKVIDYDHVYFWTVMKLYCTTLTAWTLVKDVKEQHFSLTLPSTKLCKCFCIHISNSDLWLYLWALWSKVLDECSVDRDKYTLYEYIIRLNFVYRKCDWY